MADYTQLDEMFKCWQEKDVHNQNQEFDFYWPDDDELPIEDELDNNQPAHTLVINQIVHTQYGDISLSPEQINEINKNMNEAWQSCCETPSSKKCECGSDACGIGTHADYCPKHQR